MRKPTNRPGAPLPSIPSRPRCALRLSRGRWLRALLERGLDDAHAGLRRRLRPCVDHLHAGGRRQVEAAGSSPVGEPRNEQSRRHRHGLHERKLYFHEAMDISATAHQAGTVRFGTDPATSALDVDCNAHELDNLYVVDSSFFTSIGAVNPTLTIVANALKVGEHLTERLA